MLQYIFIGLSSYLAYKIFLTSDPPKENGTYSQKGKWYTLKYWLFFVMYKLRQRQNQKKQQVSGQNAGYGMRSRSSMEEMDKAQELPKDQPKAVDAVYFNGANAEGYYFVGATARRQEKLTQTLMYLRIPGLGLLELPSLPDTSLYREEEMSFAANGFSITPVTAMKQWKLSYNGKMRLIKAEDQNDTEELSVSYDLEWNATSRFFDFDTDLDVFSMCDSMAREKWTRDYFAALKIAHQTHHEQFGEITGTVHIENYGDRELKLQGVRDHSYGNIRDWADLHRYAIQYIHLKDGTAVCLGNICMPLTMSRLIIGYVMPPDGSLDVVRSTDLELHLLGDDGKDPTDYTFNFTTASGKKYRLEGHVNERPVFYMGYKWEARIVERMCSYKINGVPGWGISEWDYRNHSGRPEKYNNRN